MIRKLIVQVRLLRDAGWILPRYRHAFGQPFEGVFSLREERIVALNRHIRVATLLQVDTMLPVAGILPLYDAVLQRATADEWVFTGFEQIDDGLRVVDTAQTWLVDLLRLETSSASTPDELRP